MPPTAVLREIPLPIPSRQAGLARSGVGRPRSPFPPLCQRGSEYSGPTGKSWPHQARGERKWSPVCWLPAWLFARPPPNDRANSRGREPAFPPGFSRTDRLMGADGTARSPPPWHSGMAQGSRNPPRIEGLDCISGAILIAHETRVEQRPRCESFLTAPQNDTALQRGGEGGYAGEGQKYKNNPSKNERHESRTLG